MIKKFLSLSFMIQAVLVGIVSGIATSLTLLDEKIFEWVVGLPILGFIFGIITAPFFIHYSNYRINTVFCLHAFFRAHCF